MSSRFVSFYISGSVFLFYALSINIPSGYGYGALLLLVSVLFLAFIKKTQASIPLKSLALPVFVLLAYFAVLLFDIVYHELPLMFLDNPSRFVFAALVALVLARSPPSLTIFWAAVIVGAMGAGILALYQKYQLNMPRPWGYDHPIQFGNISILLSFFCLAGLTWVKEQSFAWIWRIFFIVGAVLALTASLLSQSRGGWVAFPFVIAILIYSQSRVFSGKKIAFTISFIVALLVSLYFIPQTGVQTRIAQAVNDIQKYEQGNVYSSLGTRIALWKNAVILSKEKPWLGYGEPGYLDALKIRVEHKQASKHLLNYNHVHNDYLDALVKRGWTGLLALLLLYLIPLFYLFKYLKDQSDRIRAIAQAGTVLIVSYMVFGLSQGFLVHHSGMIVLAFSIVIIFSLLQKELHSGQEMSKKSKKMKKINKVIVTGGAGFIGSYMIKMLNQQGINNILVVDDLSEHAEQKFFNITQRDTRDYMDKDDFLAMILKEGLPEDTTHVIHMGACSSTTEWDGRFIMRNNFEYTKHLFHACIDAQVSFIYASSASVYGMGPTFKEDRAYENPLNMYAYSKFQFDQYLRQYQEQNNLTIQVAGLRYFNVYGPGEQHKGDMASVAFKLNTQIPETGLCKLFEGTDGYGDGGQLRDFVYVDDVCKVKWWLMNNPDVSGIFNCGTGQAQSFKDVAEAVIKWHNTGTIEYIPFPRHLEGRYQSFTQADISALRAAGYDEPFKTVEEGVKAYMDWLNPAV